MLTLNLAITIGADFGPVLLNCTEGAAAFPLAGYKAWAHVRTSPDDGLVLDLAPVILPDDAAGRITLPLINHDATAALTQGSYHWDLILEDAAGRRGDPIVGGAFTIGAINTQP